MSIEYSIREITRNGKVDDIVFNFKKEFSLLSTFLSSEITAFNDDIIESINNVVNDNAVVEEFDGNICGIRVKKDKSFIYDNLAEDGIGNCCEVDTIELLKLINDWNKATKNISI